MNITPPRQASAGVAFVLAGIVHLQSLLGIPIVNTDFTATPTGNITASGAIVNADGLQATASATQYLTVTDAGGGNRVLGFVDNNSGPSGGAVASHAISGASTTTTGNNRITGSYILNHLSGTSDPILSFQVNSGTSINAAATAGNVCYVNTRPSGAGFSITYNSGTAAVVRTTASLGTLQNTNYIVTVSIDLSSATQDTWRLQVAAAATPTTYILDTGWINTYAANITPGVMAFNGSVAGGPMRSTPFVQIDGVNFDLSGSATSIVNTNFASAPTGNITTNSTIANADGMQVVANSAQYVTITDMGGGNRVLGLVDNSSAPPSGAIAWHTITGASTTGSGNNRISGSYVLNHVSGTSDPILSFQINSGTALNAAGTANNVCYVNTRPSGAGFSITYNSGTTAVVRTTASLGTLQSTNYIVTVNLDLSSATQDTWRLQVAAAATPTTFLLDTGWINTHAANIIPGALVFNGGVANGPMRSTTFAQIDDVNFAFSGGTATGTPAVQSNAFVDTIGVNIHVHYFNTIYGNYTSLKARLLEIGVRHIRDGIEDTSFQDYFNRLNDLAANGIKMTAITDIPANRIIPVASQLTNAIEAFEGINEPNLNGFAASAASSYQASLWNTVKGNATFSNRPVYGPSVTETGYAALVGNISASLDGGNIHPYPGGWMPENTATFMGADLDSNVALGQQTCGTKPIIVTETGYTNAMNNSAGQVPLSPNGAGIYLPRLFLAYYQKGFLRTFWYELFNGGSDPMLVDVEAHYGLIENDGVTYKPAGRALRNLITLLNDPGTPFAPGSLSYTLTCSDPTLRSQLFQKRNGEFWLAVWRPVSIWDSSNPYGSKQEITVAAVNCTLQVQGSVSNITSYRNLEAASMTTTNHGAVTSVVLPIDARVAFFKITP